FVVKKYSLIEFSKIPMRLTVAAQISNNFANGTRNRFEFPNILVVGEQMRKGSIFKATVTSML
ncbi:hypothetical protein NL533_30630, partial [Klebsiella pneumoniae]|nr:hypothetical protein [Klebsiella pneumoniae]